MRASLRWLRSWYSSARSYRRCAAASSSSASSGSDLAGRPRVGGGGVRVLAPMARPSPRARCRRPRGRPASPVGSAAKPGGLARRLGERGVDVGRVVELDELGRVLDDLGLADPFAGHLVEVAAAAAERQVRRDREVVGLLVDERQAADAPRCAPCAGRGTCAAARWTGRGSRSARGRRRPRAPRAGRCGRPWLVSCSVRRLAASASRRMLIGRSSGQGWYSRSGPIRSRRNIEWWRSKIHSPARWPRARVASSASSLSSVA